MAEIETLEAEIKERNITPLAESAVKKGSKEYWKGYEKFVFRVTAVYVLLLCLPLNARFYTNLYNMDWANFNWLNLSSIASGFGAPEFITVPEDKIFGIESYVNLPVTLLVSVFAAIVWSLFDSKRKEYNIFYYWIKVITRYRIAFGIIAWGYKKFIPIQMELPSISFLYTPFADFSEQKLYWQSVGITQGYEIFLGFAEVLTGVLLLFRRTASLGALLMVALLINIVIANHAYEGMVHVHSFTFALLGAVLLWDYLPDVWNLLIKEQNVQPLKFYPVFTERQQQFRTGFKILASGIFVFFLLYLHWIDDLGYRYPHNSPGLKNTAGAYHVSEFRINNKLVAYSPLDSVRWQDAVFETWSTLTFKVNRKQQMDLDNTGRETKESISKRFEFRGIGGGRHYFDYKVDTVQQVLYLLNKNKAHRDQAMVLHYSKPSESRIVLSGINEFKDSIYVILDRVKENYPLYVGRQNVGEQKRF